MKNKIILSVSLSVLTSLMPQNTFASKLSALDLRILARGIQRLGVVPTARAMQEAEKAVSSNGYSLGAAAAVGREAVVTEEKRAVEEREKTEQFFRGLHEFEEQIKERFTGPPQDPGQADTDNLDDLERAMGALARLRFMIGEMHDDKAASTASGPDPDTATTQEIQDLEEMVANLTARLNGGSASSDAEINPGLKLQMVPVGGSFLHGEGLVAVEGVNWAVEAPQLSVLVEDVFAQLNPAVRGMGIFKTRIFGKPGGDGIAAQPSFEEKFKAQLAAQDFAEMHGELEALEGNMLTKKADRGGLETALDALKTRLGAVEATAPELFIRNNSARYFAVQALLESVQGDLEDIFTQIIEPIFAHLSSSLGGLDRDDKDPAYPVLQYMRELSEAKDLSVLSVFLSKVLSDMVFEASKTMKMGERALPLNAIRVYALALLKENGESFANLKASYGELHTTIAAYAGIASPDATSPQALVEGFIEYEMATHSFINAREALDDTSVIANEKHRSLLAKLRGDLFVYGRPGQVAVLQGGLMDQEADVQKGPMTLVQKNFYKSGMTLISKWTLMRSLNPKLGVFHGM